MNIAEFALALVVVVTFGAVRLLRLALSIGVIAFIFLADEWLTALGIALACQSTVNTRYTHPSASNSIGEVADVTVTTWRETAASTVQGFTVKPAATSTTTTSQRRQHQLIQTFSVFYLVVSSRVSRACRQETK